LTNSTLRKQQPMEKWTAGGAARDAESPSRRSGQFAQEAYPVDSGFPRCSVLSDLIGTVARADTDGEGAVARGIPEVVSRRGELRGIFDQAALAGWFCVSWLWKVPRGGAEKPTSFA
jgi:hypothetical protein